MRLTPRTLVLQLVLCATLARAADRPIRVLFPDVAAQDARSKDAASLLSSIVTGELVRSGRDVIGTADLEAKQVPAAVIAGCPGDACRAVAARLGADAVLLGSAATLRRQVGVELKLLDPATGQLLAQKTVVVPNDSHLAGTVQAALAELLQSLALRVEVALEPAKDPVAVTLPPPTPPQPGPSRLPGLLALGGCAAATVAGAVLLGSALSFNQQKSELSFNDAVVARERAQARLVAGYGLLGAGLAAATIGTVLLVSKPAAPAVALVMTPDGAAVSISGHF